MQSIKDFSKVSQISISRETEPALSLAMPKQETGEGSTVEEKVAQDGNG